MKKQGFSHESQANITHDWYTPAWIFERLGLQFDLDPCHPATKIPWIPVKNTISLPVDGLSVPWHGKVWLNPPYGQQTKDWLLKMHRHRNGIALVFSRTDCAWFHNFIVESDAILFLKGRIKFVDGLGKTSKGGAGSGSLLAAWGQECVQALEKMNDLGWFVKKYSPNHQRLRCDSENKSCNQ